MNMHCQSTKNLSLPAVLFLHAAIATSVFGVFTAQDAARSPMHAACLIPAGDGHGAPMGGHGATPTKKSGPAAKGSEPASKTPGTTKPSESNSNAAAPDAHGSDQTADVADASQGDTAPAPSIADSTTSISADEAMKKLVEGNKRWVSSKPSNPNTDADRRTETALNGQHPFACILACADSRVAVERVFDCGVGDLFTVRVAGNIAGDSETGSLEYGIEHLHTPVLVVMGHTACGAVTAATTGTVPPGAVGKVVERIEPAVDRARQLGAGDDSLVADSVRENVWQSIFDLIRFSPVVRDHMRAGNLKVVGAVYDLNTGEVKWLGEHPWQGELVAAFSQRSSAQASVDTDAENPSH